MNSLSENWGNEQASIHSVEVFLKQFRFGSALKASNIHKAKGVPAYAILTYLISLAFTGKSMFQDMRSKEPLAKGFYKDTVYRVMRMTHVNWQTLLLTIAARIAKFFAGLSAEVRLNAFIIDDSMYPRLNSKKVELSSVCFDHADSKHKYKNGFRMLTLAFTDGFSLVPLAFRHMSSRDGKLRICDANPSIDRRSCGGRIRAEALQKSTELIIPMLKRALVFGIPAKHVLFDCWFANPCTITAIAGLGLKTVCRIKNGKTKYLFEGNRQTLSQIYRSCRKRRGLSKYLLSVAISIIGNDGTILPARLVYVRDRSNSKKWIALLSTDMELPEEEIIRLYGKRWDIEVFFKMCKSYLKLTGEFQQLSYDAITAHTTIVMLRYMMLAVEKRRLKDPRSLAEMFFDFYDEAADIKFEQAIRLVYSLLHDIVCNPIIGLTEIQIDMILQEFIFALPTYIRKCIEPNKPRIAA